VSFELCSLVYIYIYIHKEREGGEGGREGGEREREIERENETVDKQTTGDAAGTSRVVSVSNFFENIHYRTVMKLKQKTLSRKKSRNYIIIMKVLKIK
jgi:hypothetical protein